MPHPDTIRERQDVVRQIHLDVLVQRAIEWVGGVTTFKKAATSPFDRLEVDLPGYFRAIERPPCIGREQRVITLPPNGWGKMSGGDESLQMIYAIVPASFFAKRVDEGCRGADQPPPRRTRSRLAELKAKIALIAGECLVTAEPGERDRHMAACQL